MSLKTTSLPEEKTAPLTPATGRVTLRLRLLLFTGFLWGAVMFAGGAAGGYVIGDGGSLSLWGQYRYEPPFRIVRASEAQTYVDFSLMQEAVGLLQEHHWQPLLSNDELNHTAIQGVLQGLDDPYTNLMEPETARRDAERMKGEFGGIGAHTAWDEELQLIRIVALFPDSPALQGGLQSNDLLTHVDGESISELGMTDTLFKVRGPVGTEVVLGIQRGEESWDVTLVRAVIELPVVEYSLKGEDESVGYVKLTTFNRKSPDKMREALTDVLAQDIEALILDLRNNAGGLLHESVEVAGLFSGPALIVSQQDRDGTEQPYRARRQALVPEQMPLVILVNEASASASEVVAGALQDLERAVLMGETTFGKGSVQTGHTLSDQSLLRITSARWFTPLGRTMDVQGLEPDLRVEMTPEHYEADLDPQLDAALAYISGLMD